MGVLLIYAGVVRLGRELCLLMSCRHLDALAVASAPLLLGESLGSLKLGGAALILAALAVGGQEDGPVTRAAAFSPLGKEWSWRLIKSPSVTLYFKGKGNRAITQQRLQTTISRNSLAQSS